MPIYVNKSFKSEINYPGKNLKKGVSMNNTLKNILALFIMIIYFQDSNSQTVGNYTSHKVAGNNITFNCSSGARVKLDLCKPDIVRIQMAVSGRDFVANESYIIVKYDWPAVDATVSDAGNYIKIVTNEMVIRVSKTPFRLDFYENDNKTLITRQSSMNSIGWQGTSKTMTFEKDPAGKIEHFFGCGMQWKHFDLRGLNMLNYQIRGDSKNQSGASETANPYYWSTAGYGMLLHNSFKSSFDFGKADSSLISWNVSDGELDFYFIKGPSFKKIIQGYCDLTGYLEMPPVKTLGLTYRAQGNNGYQIPRPVYLGASDLDSITDGFREHGVPCDIIGTEPGWAPGYGNIVWLNSKFPDPQAWCNRMINKGFLPNMWMLGPILDPEVQTLLKPYVGPKRYLDVISKEGMDAYFGYLKTNFWDRGVMGFKEDSHGEVDTSLTLPSGASLKEYHNSYWYIWMQGLFKRYKETYNKRFFSFCCALWTGAQRYPLVAYSDMGIRITWISNSGWTGMAYTPELQGWSGPKSYTALHSVAFTPYMVQNEWINGQLPWSSDQNSFKVYLRYTRLHYRLIPYIYSHLWEQHNTGIGPVRPLALEFQDDPVTYSISNQYFYGKDLMVSFDHSNIYLPKGNWIYYWDGRSFSGGVWLTGFGAPEDELPVFVRAGAIIPMMPDMNFVGEKPVDPLIVDVYPEGTSSFTLYEDDGVTFNYEKGDYCETLYQVTGNNKNVIINIRARKAPGAYTPPSRHYLFRVHNGADPVNVNKDGKVLARKKSEADLGSSTDSWYFSDGITQVRFTDTGKDMKVILCK